jgi:hypothetical protein
LNTTSKGGAPSPFSIPNIRLFIAFRVLFNSRFYYPVFTILFLDFGLTVAQFSMLNAVWAATMRFPLYLTLILAIFAFITTLRMKDPAAGSLAGVKQKQVRQAFGLTIKAGLWIYKTPFVLSVILFGMLFDGIIRMVITLSSQYYRMIHLPESIFGIIGALVAMLGFVIPKIAKSIIENCHRC